MTLWFRTRYVSIFRSLLTPRRGGQTWRGGGCLSRPANGLHTSVAMLHSLPRKEPSPKWFLLTSILLTCTNTPHRVNLSLSKSRYHHRASHIRTAKKPNSSRTGLVTAGV